MRSQRRLDLKHAAFALFLVATAGMRLSAQAPDWQAPVNGRPLDISTPVGYSAAGTPLYLIRSAVQGVTRIGWFDSGTGRATLMSVDRPAAARAFEVYAGAGRWVPSTVDTVPADSITAGTDANGQPMNILRVSAGGWLIPAIYSADDNAAVAFVGGRRLLFSSFEALVPDWARAAGSFRQAFRGGTDSDGGPLVPFRAAYGGGLQPGKFNTAARRGYISYGGQEITIDDPSAEVFVGTGIWTPSNGNLPAGAIPAGVDTDGSTLYMIRALHDGAQALGKFSAQRGEAYIPYGGIEWKVSDFEVLCYDLSRNRADSQVLVPVAAAPAQAAAETNFLRNPSAEIQPVTRMGWKVASGDWTRPITLADAGLTAVDGDRVFWPGKVPSGELYQDVPIAAFGRSLVGSSQVVFEAFLSGFPGDPDTAQVVMEARESSGVVLASIDSRPQNYSTWTRVTLSLDLPPATGFVRVRLVGTRLRGEDNDAYFDKLSLRVQQPDAVENPPPAASSTDTNTPVAAAAGWDPLAMTPGFVLPPARMPADFAGRLAVLWAPLPTDLYAAAPSLKAPFGTGSLNPALVRQALAIHNLFRFAAGVPEVTVDPQWSRAAQAGAVLLAAINRLDHTPPFPAAIGMDKAFYDQGYLGTSTSNIHFGPADTGVADALRGQMDDSYGSNLASLGHRRWLLEPTTAKVGYGQAGSFTTIKAFGDGGRPTNLAAVAWPPAGWVPLDLFVARQAWSISLNPRAFHGGKVAGTPDTAVTITRQRDGRTWTFKDGGGDGSFSIDRSAYGLPVCLIFKPNDMGLILGGDSYRVEVHGLQDGTGAPILLAYTTAFFSPESGTLKLPASTHPKNVTLHVDWQNQGTGVFHTDSDQPDTYLNTSGKPLTGLRLVVDTPEGVLPVSIQINGQPRLFGPGEWAQSLDGGPIHQFRLVFGGLYGVLQFVGFHDKKWMREYFSPYTLDIGPASLEALAFRVKL